MIETQEELDEFDGELMPFGPRGGGIPGVVRRVRRVLDVSQRGLAALLGVSQSVVARWETGRTSPRAEVLVRLARMAGLDLALLNEEGDVEPPMRDDGIRDRGARRFPAHVDLTARTWWTPRASFSSAEHPSWLARSRRSAIPAVRFHVQPWRRKIMRMLHGTPVDHPSLNQMVAEVMWWDERREERRRAVEDRFGMPPAWRRTA